MSKKDPRLTKLGLDRYNQAKKTPNHPTKSHVVVPNIFNNTRRFNLIFVSAFNNASVFKVRPLIKKIPALQP